VNPKDVVRTGYDAVSYAYRADTEDNDCAEYLEWLEQLVPSLQPGAAILDLGCGNGIPVARRLAEAFEVTGVDISPVQIERASRNVLQSRFICADMAGVSFAPESFDAVVAFYSIIHVPVEEQPSLFRNLHSWLRPGGYLMATVGSRAWTGYEHNWLGSGVAMYWSHADEVTYNAWLVDAEFEVLWTRFIPEGKGGHTLVLARR